MTTTRLLIARHGNTFAPGDVITRVGTTDLPLVESGLEQGRRLGLYLKQHNLLPDVIFTSQLKRARQTAEQAQEAMGTKLPMATLAIFNEIDYGPDENQPEELVVGRLGSEALKAWESSAQVPNGWNVDPSAVIQNWQSFAARLSREFAGRTILVVTSNGIARFSPYLTGDFAAFSSQHSIKIATGAVCLLEHKPPSAAWTVVQWNTKPSAALETELPK